MKIILSKLITGICMVCASSMFLLGCTGEKGTITYEFSGSDAEKPGYAEGTITFTAKEAGTYNLYWSDDIGALEGYYEIAKMNIEGEKAVAEVDFGYHTAIPVDATLPLNAEFKALLEEYKDMIWISGHAHEAYELGYNYTDNGENACHMIHNSSVGNPTYVTDGEIDYSFNEDKSQGYYVEVFEKAIVFNGANLCDEKIYPAYSYIIDGDTQAEEVEEKTYRTDWAMTAGKVRSIQANAKSVLGVYYEYSSYDNYQRLKKSYYKYKDADIDSMTNEELSAMYDELGKGIRSLCELVEGVELVALTKK